MGLRASAGLLLYRHDSSGSDECEVLLAHMGGPYWSRRERAWSIPKGEYGPDEDPLAAARREFAEELGSSPPSATPLALGEVTQSGGKIVTAWAVVGDFDVTTARSSEFEIEWPPRSGHRQSFPEIDRAEWFTIDEARSRIVAAQEAFLDRLLAELSDSQTAEA